MRLMRDLKSSRAMWLKGAAFVVIAALSSGLLLLESPSWREATLLALAIWSSCRAYYFVFYVIEHYVDPEFRYSGLGSFIAYAFRKRRV